MFDKEIELLDEIAPGLRYETESLSFLTESGRPIK
jgi:hypothetical protein